MPQTIKLEPSQYEDIASRKKSTILLPIAEYEKFNIGDDVVCDFGSGAVLTVSVRYKSMLTVDKGLTLRCCIEIDLLRNGEPKLISMPYFCSHECTPDIVEYIKDKYGYNRDGLFAGVWLKIEPKIIV